MLACCWEKEHGAGSGWRGDVRDTTIGGTRCFVTSVSRRPSRPPARPEASAARTTRSPPSRTPWCTPSKAWRSWPRRPLRPAWSRTTPTPFIEEGLFTTLTNVNFDPEALTDWVRKTVDRREKLKAALAAKQPGVTFPEGPATFVAGVHLRGGRRAGPRARRQHRSLGRREPPLAAAHRPLRPQGRRRLRSPRSRARLHATRPSTTTTSKRWPTSPATTRAT